MVNIWSIFSQLIGAACPLCGTSATGICSDCAAELPLNSHSCGRCALPLPDTAPPASLCADCQRHPRAFDSTFAPFRYAYPIDDLTSGLKYHGRLGLARVLATVMLRHLADEPRDTDLLVPLPAGAQRLRQRGFNQSAEICRQLSRALSVPWSASVLHRNHQHQAQRGLGRRERQRNVRGAFHCSRAITGRVILVDDVMTTGASAHEASRVIKRAGASRVDVWVIARTPGSTPAAPGIG
jgi:ComF family protein